MYGKKALKERNWMPEFAEEDGFCLVCGDEIGENNSYAEIETGLHHRDCL